MSRLALLHYDGQFATLAIRDEDDLVRVIDTCRIHPGRYIRIDDGRRYPQLCANGSRYGATLIAHRDEAQIGRALARDCEARYYPTRAGFDRALAKLKALEG